MLYFPFASNEPVSRFLLLLIIKMFQRRPQQSFGLCLGPLICLDLKDLKAKQMVTKRQFFQSKKLFTYLVILLRLYHMTDSIWPTISLKYDRLKMTNLTLSKTDLRWLTWLCVWPTTVNYHSMKVPNIKMLLHLLYTVRLAWTGPQALLTSLANPAHFPRSQGFIEF